MLKRLKTTHFKPLQPYIPHNCIYIVPNHGAKSRSTAKKTALDKEFSHSPAVWGTVGRARLLLPCPGTAGPPGKCLPNPRKQGFSLPGSPPTAPASPVFSAPPRRSMADPARADRRQREAARAKQKELRICCEALLAVFVCPFCTGATGVYFFWPRIPREAALRRFIRVFLMSLTLRASTSSEFLRMVSQ